jgi:hypothetical protein
MQDTSNQANKTSRRTTKPKIFSAFKNTPPPVLLTFFKTPGDRLSKQYLPHATKGIEKIDGTQMWRGTFKVAAFDLAAGIRPALTKVGQQLEKLGRCEAIALSTPKDGLLEGQIVTKGFEKEQGKLPPGTITRSLDHFGFADGPGLLLLDADDSDKVWDIANALYPPMKSVAMLTRPSASSCVINPKTGKPLKNSAHGYVVIDNPSRSKDALQAFMRLAWCTGSGETRGWIKLAEDGAALTRGPFDASVGSAERLSYEGEATVDPNLKQLPRICTLAGDGDGMLNAADLIAYAGRVAPEARYNELVAAAKNAPKFVADQAAKKAAHRAEHIATQVERGKSAEQAAAEYDRVYNAPGKIVGDRTLQELPPGHVIPWPDGTTFTVEDVQRDPWAFVHKECADPIEGMDYPSKSCGWIEMAGDVIIYSQAHGNARAFVIPIDLSKTVFGELLRKFFALHNIPLPIAAPKWRESYASGLPKPSLENARLAIQKLGIICQYNEFTSELA